MYTKNVLNYMNVTNCKIPLTRFLLKTIHINNFKTKRKQI